MNHHEAKLVLRRVYQGRLDIPYEVLREARIVLGIIQEEEL